MRLLFLFLLTTTLGFGQATISSNTEGDISEIIANTKNGMVSQQLRDRFAINSIRGTSYPRSRASRYFAHFILT